MTSNSLGRKFGKGFKKEELLSEQYEQFISELEPEDFPSELWEIMPDEEKNHIVMRWEMKFTSIGKGLPNWLLKETKNTVGQDDG